jgi:hypothetical protein
MMHCRTTPQFYRTLQILRCSVTGQKLPSLVLDHSEDTQILRMSVNSVDADRKTARKILHPTRFTLYIYIAS